MTPLISVIMPVYNAAEDYLRTAMESILQQTCGDFEFIIINDGSTNNTESVILSYDDKRIRYVKNDRNLQITASLNKGLGLANGEYIARIDADDYSDKLRFEKQINIMNNNDKIGLAGTYTIEIPTNEEIVPPTDDKDMKLLLKYCTNCIVHSSVMLRKSVLDEHNLKYNPKALHAEDYRLWCDMADYCEFTTIPEFIQHKKVFNIVSDSSNNEFDTDITYKNVNDAELDFNWDDVPYKFITPDGVMYGLTSMSTRNNETQIGFCFDINGEKAPNQVGKDFHQVVINDNGSITPITPAPEDFDDLADMVNQCESQNGEWDYTTGSCQQRRPGQTY